MNTHSIEDFVLGSNKSQIYLFDSPKMFFFKYYNQIWKFCQLVLLQIYAFSTDQRRMVLIFTAFQFLEHGVCVTAGGLSNEIT